MSAAVRELTSKSSAILERVIIDSTKAQGRADAADGRSPARENDPTYLEAFLATRRQILYGVK